MAYNGGLKREREDEEEQQHGAPAPPGASRARLDPPTPDLPVRVRPLVPGRIADAARFLEVLQREFAGKPDKLNEFWTILLHYYYMSIDMVWRMQIVLQGYPDLIRGFNTFLPRGYALKLDDQQGGGGAGDA